MESSHGSGVEPGILPAEVTRQFVLTKCEYFVDVQLWPLTSQINPERWLGNFATPEDSAHALHLLNAFMYFSETLIDQMFVAAIQSLSTKLPSRSKSIRAASDEWERFLKSALVVHVTGETPSTTDSGFAFARRARQLLGVDERHILDPAHALKVVLELGPRPVIFVDDFAGSGEQFLSTWRRKVRAGDGSWRSFEDLGASAGERIYSPVICTEYARTRINAQTRDISIAAAHVLPRRYSALIDSDESLIWPPHLRSTAVDFLRRSSRRAGIPEHMWKGFHDLGLALALGGSVPDATLPLFYWEANGWHPLIRRR